MDRPRQPVLQLCHSHGPPFDDVARQWRALFVDSGYRVVTVFLTGKADEDVAKLVGGEVLFLGYQSRDIRGLKRKQIAAIRRLHKEYHFALLIAHRYKPIFIAAHIPEVPLIGVSHGFGVYDGYFRRLFIRRQQQRLLLLGVSNAIRDDARKALGLVPTERIQTLYNHVDAEKFAVGQFDRKVARERLGLPEDAFVIGNVGRLHDDKDHHTLVAAFAKAASCSPQWVLAIIGEGPLEGELREQAKKLGVDDQVRFIGWIPDAWRYFKAFDLFALTSRREGFGMVLLEAMAAGVPILSSRVGGAPEVLGDYGQLFEQGDVAALAALMGQAAGGGDGGLERVKQYFSDEAARNTFWAHLKSVGFLL